MTQVRVAGVVKESVVDGPGFRFVVFAQGCLLSCEGCHNPQTQDISGGSLVPVSEIIAEIRQGKLTTGVTFSGGEPFLQPRSFREIGEAVVAMGKDIVIFTGYTFEQLLELASADSDVDALIRMSRLIVDGPFVMAERDLTLAFRGSRNQRIIDVQNSLATGSIVEWEMVG